MHMVYYRGWNDWCINFFLIRPVQRLFPEKLSRCQWLPIVSEAVVKCPVVRLSLATITMAVIIFLAVFNLVRFHLSPSLSLPFLPSLPVSLYHTWHYTQKWQWAQVRTQTWIGRGNNHPDHQHHSVGPRHLKDKNRDQYQFRLKKLKDENTLTPE